MTTAHACKPHNLQHLVADWTSTGYFFPGSICNSLAELTQECNAPLLLLDGFVNKQSMLKRDQQVKQRVLQGKFGESTRADANGQPHVPEAFGLY